jgi:hypothetical protein
VQGASQERQDSRSAVGKGISVGVVDVKGVGIWDSVPEKSWGVEAPLVEVEVGG